MCTYKGRGPYDILSLVVPHMVGLWTRGFSLGGGAASSIALMPIGAPLRNSWATVRKQRLLLLVQTARQARQLMFKGCG